VEAASLSAYVDGQLAAGEQARVERHVGACDRCQAELARLRRLAALLTDALATPAEDRWQARVRARERIAAFRHAGRSPRWAWWELPDSALPVLGGALLVLLALAETITFGGLQEDALAIVSLLGLI
jgi:anti-sigma factor RsiW